MYCIEENRQHILPKDHSIHISYNRQKYSDGTTSCLKGMPDVKITKTVMTVFTNTTAEQGKMTLATDSPQRQTNQPLSKHPFLCQHCSLVYIINNIINLYLLSIVLIYFEGKIISHKLYFWTRFRNIILPSLQVVTSKKTQFYFNHGV